MKKYKCHKVVEAIEIGKIEGRRIFDLNNSDVFFDVPEDFFVRNTKCNLPGYLVKYEDGYLSWSPKDVFESGYAAMGMENGILKYFKYKHLPDKLQAISKPIGKLAYEMDRELPDGPEKSAGLRKLLEAKDCFVRANL